jgi:hypothetical protein
MPAISDLCIFSFPKLESEAIFVAKNKECANKNLINYYENG